MLGLGLSLTTGGVATPAYVALAKAFVSRVEADGGTVESFACLKTDMAYLTSNPAAPAGYTAEWSAATVGSSAEFRINLVGGAGYTYTYAVTDSQATEVTGSGVMSGNIQAVTVDLSTLVDGTVTLAVYLTGAGGDGTVVTDTALKAANGPILQTSPVASGTAQVGQTLSTTDGTWQGFTPITFAYQWRRDAINISGATSSTYTLVAADYTTDIDCVVTATNSLGSASADSNDILNIAGTTPVISGVPTISSQTQVGETITATAASVSGVPTPTTSWQWQRSADGSTGWANISAATSTTYVLVEADDTNYIRAVQTETNAVGSDSANSAASAQISQGSAFDADYQAVLDRASTLGYTAPSAAQQTLQNTLVEDLKTAGVWSKLDAFYLFATDGDSDYATLNFVAPSNFQATKTNSPTFTADEGFTGDGVSAYLDTNLNASTDTTNYTQNDASFGAYAWNAIASTEGHYPITADDVSIALRWAASRGQNRINSNTPTTRGVISTNNTGLIGMSRTSSTDYQGLDESGTINSGYLANSIALPNKAFVVLKGQTNYSTNKIGVAWIGGSFTSAEWSDYVDAVDTYIAAL